MNKINIEVMMTAEELRGMLVKKSPDLMGEGGQVKRRNDKIIQIQHKLDWRFRAVDKLLDLEAESLQEFHHVVLDSVQSARLA